MSRIILGIDPGTSVMGYGLLKVDGQKLHAIQYGVIHLSKYNNHALKLQKIFQRVMGIIDEYMPDEMALEAPFYGKNVQSMLKLGRAQGVAMAAALVRDIPITEYAPKRIKQAITGNGNASKEQLAHMLLRLLNLQEMPKLLDASDALGVAVCHAWQRDQPKQQSTTWANFVREQPHRLKK